MQQIGSRQATSQRSSKETSSLEILVLTQQFGQMMKSVAGESIPSTRKGRLLESSPLLYLERRTTWLSAPGSAWAAPPRKRRGRYHHLRRRELRYLCHFRTRRRHYLHGSEEVRSTCHDQAWWHHHLRRGKLRCRHFNTAYASCYLLQGQRRAADCGKGSPGHYDMCRSKLYWSDDGGNCVRLSNRHHLRYGRPPYTDG